MKLKKPAFDIFAPGSLVRAGGNTGVVLDVSYPSEKEFGEFIGLSDSLNIRVPVRWDVTGRISWCRVDDNLLHFVSDV